MPAHTTAHTETTGHENLEHAEAGMPQLDVGLFPNLIFWLVVAIVALYWILSKVALPRIATVLAERNDAIANDIEQAALLKKRAEEAEAAYNAALAKARDEAHKIAAETKAGIDKELSIAPRQGRRRDRGEDGGVREAHRRDPRQRREERRGGRPETAAALVEALLPGRRRPSRGRCRRRQPAEGLTPWSSSTTPRSSSASAS